MWTVSQSDTPAGVGLSGRKRLERLVEWRFTKLRAQKPMGRLALQQAKKINLTLLIPDRKCHFARLMPHVQNDAR